jgi:cathepsin L
MIVAYDDTAPTPFWTIKNSWGTSWGMSGYIEVAITTGNGICGVNVDPTFPNLN